MLGSSKAATPSALSTLLPPGRLCLMQKKTPSIEKGEKTAKHCACCKCEQMVRVVLGMTRFSSNKKKDEYLLFFQTDYVDVEPPSQSQQKSLASSASSVSGQSMRSGSQFSSSGSTYVKHILTSLTMVERPPCEVNVKIKISEVPLFSQGTMTSYINVETTTGQRTAAPRVLPSATLPPPTVCSVTRNLCYLPREVTSVLPPRRQIIRPTPEATREATPMTSRHWLAVRVQKSSTCSAHSHKTHTQLFSGLLSTDTTKTTLKQVRFSAKAERPPHHVIT